MCSRVEPLRVMPALCFNGYPSNVRAWMARVASAVVGCLLWFSPVWSASVVSTSPGSLDSWPDAALEIVVDFDLPLDSTSLTSSTVAVFGRWSGPRPGTFSLEAGDTRLRFVPADSFSRGEMVTVNLPHSVRFTNGDSLAFGYAWQFMIRPLPGTLDLVAIDTLSLRLPSEGHIQSYGAYAGDLNHDGKSDLSIPNEISVDVRVCLNDGTGGYDSFTVYDMPGGQTPSPNEGGDFNRDGHIDLAVGNAGNDKLTVFFGDGLGAFGTPDNYVSGSAVRGVCVIDLDADGDDDLVTANRTGNNIRLFFNDGTGQFDSSFTQEASLTNETAVAQADFNGDGILDVAVGAYAGQEVAILLGDALGHLIFSEKINVGGRVWMLATGDLDGDGDADVASANSINNNTALAFGDGAGGFDSVKVYPGGSFTLAVDVGDIDGDGDLDVVTSHYSNAVFLLWENNGSGVLLGPDTYMAESAGSCALLHDRDSDGDLDMTGIDEDADLVILFDNTCPVPLVGDINHDLALSSGDIVLLVNVVFKGAPPPAPCLELGDVNCSGLVTSGDIILLVNHIFKSGEPPCTLCECP